MGRDYYNENFELLKSAYDWIIDDLKEKENKKTVCSYETKEGTVGFYIDCEENGFVQLGSQYAPDKYAQKWCQSVYGQQPFEENGVVFVFGFGSGEYIRALYEHATDHTLIIIIEPSLDVMDKIMHEIDLSQYISKKRMIITCGRKGLRTFHQLIWRVLLIENINLQCFYELPNYANLFPEEYEMVRKMLKDGYTNLLLKENTRKRFSTKFAKNMLESTRHLLYGSSLDKLVTTLPEGVPAIIIAAGPSLEKNIEELKRAKGKAFLIAVDTALKPLLARGIIPDLFVMIDPIKYDELFEDERIWNIPAVIDESARGTIIKKLRNKIFISAPRRSVFKIIIERLAREDNNRYLYTGGSVANSAFSLALEANMNPVILVGQDLAYTDDKTHIKGAFHRDVALEQEEIDGSIMVEDINGNMVRTAVNLDLYRRWFEETIENNEKTTFIDATEGGAKIKGTEIKSLKDTIDEYCMTEYDYGSFIQSCGYLFDSTERERAYEEVMKLPKEAEDVLDDCEKLVSYYKELEELSQADKIEGSVLKELLEKIGEKTEYLEKDSLIYLLLEQYISAVSGIFALNIQKQYDDVREDLADIAQRGLLYMEVVKQGVKELIPIIEEFVEETKEEYEIRKHEFE